MGEEEDTIRDDERTKMAQRRWRLLARALTRSSLEVPADERVMKMNIKDDQEEEIISVRRFASFNLIEPIPMEHGRSASWYEYRTWIGEDLFTVEIRRIRKTCFTANELMGFNNTGNVCVWPSEECLAYYLLNNPDICRNRRLLELGGGMSCLAGVYAAKYCEPAGVTLTDGNVTSVDNVRCIVARNKMADFVKCAVLQWASSPPLSPSSSSFSSSSISSSSSSSSSDENTSSFLLNSTLHTSKRNVDEDELSRRRSRSEESLYEVILSADCLFFDEARIDLVETIYGWLADNGIALLMAPRRGRTFQEFAEAAVKRGFLARVTERYDLNLWSRHLELIQTGHEYYSPDLHYPILLELTKNNTKISFSSSPLSLND